MDPKLPYYSTYRSRIDTYCTFWNLVCKVKAKYLAASGFICLKTKDAVQCHHCGIVLVNFKEGEDANEEHLKCNPNCIYALLYRTRKRNPEFIEPYNQLSNDEVDVVHMRDLHSDEN
ncbi:E3 ubiquitin-protein ligase XIAP [Halotydeus destructor]|nr:E3 ubiquitin-protein ligase XIAP [Halotydeus destructor]